MTDKKSIRKTISEKRTNLSEAYIRNYSNACMAKIMNLPEFKNSACIYAYMAYRNEISCEILIEAALKQGKRVALPKVSEGGSMEFFCVSGAEETSEGFCGICEPDGSGEVSKDESVLMIMPGLAFGRDHSRIGFGGGYYDRYLEKAVKECRQIFKLAPAYEFQIFDTLPCEPHDIKTDMVVSASEVIL